MRTESRKLVSLGDVVVAAFDHARRITRDSRRTPLLATCAVSRLLFRTGNAALVRRLTRQRHRLEVGK